MKIVPTAISGHLNIGLTFTLDRIEEVYGMLTRKPVAVFKDQLGNEVKLAVGDNLSMNLPLDVNNNKDSETIKKIKGLVKELSE